MGSRRGGGDPRERLCRGRGRRGRRDRRRPARGGAVILEGRAVLIPGDDVDTDVMYPGRYLNIDDPDEMKDVPLRGLRPVAPRPARRGCDHRHRPQLRHRLVARARRPGVEGVGRARGRRAELRPHLPAELRQPRARRRRGAGGRGCGEAAGRGCASTPRRATIDVDGSRYEAAPLAPLRRRAAGGGRPRPVDGASGGAPMIVRDAGDAWQVVLQTDHADLSGAFARAWSEQGRAPRRARDRRRRATTTAGRSGSGRRASTRAASRSTSSRSTSARTSPSTAPGSPRSPSTTPTRGCSCRCTARASTGSATGSTRRSR